MTDDVAKPTLRDKCTHMYEGYHCDLENGHDGPCPAKPYRWRLRVKRLGRFEDLRTMLGWRWEWRISEWEQSALEWWPPALWGYSGRCRSEPAAAAAAESATLYFERQSVVDEKALNVWFHD